MNFKEIMIKLGIATVLLLVSLTAFFLLQHWWVYDHTLGLISKNYEHLANGDIIQKKIPFTSLSEANFLHWDAAHYENIRDHSYIVHKKFGEACYAFFPLFPWIWKITHLNAIGISLLNYFLFVVSLIILSSLFTVKTLSKRQQLFLYALALLLPGSVVFNIPYTESVFIFTFSLACYFLKRNNRLMFVIFFALVGFTRPAITLLLASLIGTDIYFALTGRAYQTKPSRVALRMVPLFIGTIAALYVQRLYSGEWFKVFEVQHNWGYHNFQWPTKFSDWSHEGYGMSVFALVGIFLPALYYLVSSFLKKLSFKSVKVQHSQGFEQDKDYFFVLSVFYLVVITLFTLFFRGGLLNGLQRYALATPFLYIIFFSLPGKLGSVTKITRRWILPAILSGGILFIALNSYGGGFSFPHLGFYLYVGCFGYLLWYHKLNLKPGIITGLLLIGLLILWKVYLLNMFLSDGWIFT